MGRELRMECQEPPSCLEIEMLDREGTVRGLVRAQRDGFHGDQRKRQQEVIIIATFFDLSFSELVGGVLVSLCLGNFTGPSLLDLPKSD